MLLLVVVRSFGFNDGEEIVCCVSLEYDDDDNVE